MAHIGSKPLPTLTTATATTTTTVASTATRNLPVVTNVGAALGNALAGTNVTDPDDALIKSLVVPAKGMGLTDTDQEKEVPGAFVIDFTKLHELDSDQQARLMGRLGAEVTKRIDDWDTANASNSSAATGNTTTVNNAATATAAPNSAGANAPAGAHTALGQMLGPYKGAFGAVMGALAGGAIMGAVAGVAESLATAKATALVLEQKNVTYSHGELRQDGGLYDAGPVDDNENARTTLPKALDEQWAAPDRVAVFPALPDGISVAQSAFPPGGDPVADPRNDQPGVSNFARLVYDPGNRVNGTKTIFHYVQPLANHTVNAFVQNPALWAAIGVPAPIVILGCAIGGYYLALKHL